MTEAVESERAIVWRYVNAEIQIKMNKAPKKTFLRKEDDVKRKMLLESIKSKKLKTQQKIISVKS